MTHTRLLPLCTCSPGENSTRRVAYDNRDRASAAGRNETVCAAQESWVFPSCLDLSGHVPLLILLRLAIKQRAPARRPQISSIFYFLFVEPNLTFSLLKHFVRLCVFMCIPNTPEQMWQPYNKIWIPYSERNGSSGSTNSPWLNTHVFKNTPTLIFSLNFVVSTYVGTRSSRWLTYECMERWSLSFKRLERKPNSIY